MCFVKAFEKKIKGVIESLEIKGVIKSFCGTIYSIIVYARLNFTI